LIDYDGRIRVRKALLNVILHDDFPDDNAVRPAIANIPQHLTPCTHRVRFSIKGSNPKQ
jgi:hypothetical protein